ncbi:MAG: TPM domain-containing protein [Ruminococcaceae bacterium]|nr:TPM domain-containing protein [Oscillospiraceae bacterium]
MKKYIKNLLLFIICLSVSLSCFAGFGVFAATDPRLVDDADILTDEEELILITMLDEVSEKIKLDVVIVTVDDMGYKTAEAFADDYMDYNGYGYNGGEDCVLLAVGMDEREYHFSTRGFGIDAFTDDAIDNTKEVLEDHLTFDEYYDAFVAFVELTEGYVTSAREGSPYKAPFSFFSNLFVAVAIGFVIALISVSVMKAQLKSVRSNYSAKGYEKQGSMDVKNSSDVFLYKTVSKTARPKSSSSGGGGGTHRSSSGRSHGGGGGRF